MARQRRSSAEVYAELQEALAACSHLPDEIRWMARANARALWRQRVEKRHFGLLRKQSRRKHRNEMRRRMRDLRAHRRQMFTVNPPYSEGSCRLHTDTNAKGD